MDEAYPRRFHLVRTEDVNNMSGIGKVASGVCFHDMVCVMRWNTDIASTAVYAHPRDIERIHGHEGRTTIEWIDTPPLY